MAYFDSTNECMGGLGLIFGRVAVKISENMYCVGTCTLQLMHTRDEAAQNA